MAEILEKESFLPNITDEKKVNIYINGQQIDDFSLYGKYASIKVIIEGDENQYEKLVTKQGFCDLLQ